MSIENQNQEVTVVDIEMPFMSMVAFMVKFAIASIPAFIIISILYVVFAGVFIGLLESYN
jgi:hypothetical protein